MRNLIGYGVLTALLALAGWFGWRSEAERRGAVERVKQLEGELAKKGIAVPAESSAVAVLEKAAPSPEKKAAGPKASVEVGPYLRMIDELRQRTQELEREVQTVRGEMARADARAAAQKEALEKSEEEAARIREAVQKEQRLSEALEAELKVKSQRMIQAEQAEKVMTERLGRAEATAKKAVGTSKEIEDLNRRRETVLTALERRYRDVTDLYRNFSLNLQTRETPGQGLQAGDLSRIQTALQLAEEELRQLRSLNARVAELARAK
jgi:chromosome segregation ATPase